MSERASEQRAGELTQLRRDIEAVDRRIVELLAERLELGRRTGEIKREAGRPILDAAREAEVIRRAVTTARELGVPPEATREIFWHIVGMSRRVQEGGDAP
jgi:chorismate mutase / prephenate dehydrogenase